jgi:hypothetical protein
MIDRADEEAIRLTAERLEVEDYDGWLALAYRRRWTDGLPVVPPTPDKVAAMIRAAGREPDDSLGTIPPRYGNATVEKLAINAVMAGCEPEHFPVVLAAVEALLDPAFNLGGVQTTTHLCEPLIIVGGPIVDALGFSTGHAVFGGGARANATIGRAVSLILWNLGGSYPGDPDKTTFGQPGHWSFCIGERREGNPWPPLHAERGVDADASAVTVFACEPPHSLLTWGTADRILWCLAEGISYPGSNNSYTMGQALFVLGAEAARTLAAAGLSREQIRQSVWERARVPLWRLKRAGWEETYARQWYPAAVNLEDSEALVPLTARPEDMHLLVAGGEGRFTAVCPGWGGFGGLAVTREIALPR